MLKATVLIIGLVIAASVFGASAFTSGYVDRSASINVVGDSTGLIQFADGNSGNLVRLDADNNLDIDFTLTGASGANTDGHFELGDPNAGNVTYAFTATNKDSTAHTLKLTYTSTSPDADATANVKFQVYDSAGTLLVTATDESGEVSDTADGFASGETVYVVVIVDTTSKVTTDDLSGTLQVKVE